MGNWSKVWLAASALSLLFILTACGKDNGQDSVQANTAPPKANNCMNGQNCSWQAGQYPSQWTAYPRYSNGTYNYNYYSGQNSGCGAYGYPYYDYYRGFICVPIDNGMANSFWRGTWAGGSYFQGCDMLFNWNTVYPSGLANPCYGRCFALNGANAQWGNSWNTGAYARYGACQ
jgi:hypothetical protein